MHEPVRVILTGDISGARDIADEASKRSAPDYMFQHVKDVLQGSDVAFGNFECAVPCRTGKVVLVAPETFPKAVADAGFDIVSLANNHSFDAGEEGFRNTTRLLKDLNVDVIGGVGGQPVIKDIKGIKLGFQACVDSEWAPSPKHPTILCTDFLKGLKELRPKVDALFVSVHWGKEYDKATPRQKKIAALLLEAGADVIIGHHPHVPQEVMVTKKGQWVFYSLGNFVFDSHVGGPETKKGFAVSLDVTPEGITNVKKIPYALGDPTPEGTPYCAPSWVSAKKVAAKYLDPKKVPPTARHKINWDYSDLINGKMTLKEFTSKYRIKAVPRLKWEGKYYDCGRHAQLFKDNIYGEWGHKQSPKPIPWSKAKRGDFVQWGTGMWSHYGVVINPSQKLVESCWGVDHYVFQHPVDVSPYEGKPLVYAITSNKKVAARYLAER